MSHEKNGEISRATGMMSSATNSAIFHKSLQKTYPTAVGGTGVYLATADGRRVLDGSSGAAVSSLGHGNAEVVEAICAQAHELAFAHSSFFTSGPAEKLAEFIISHSGSGDGAEPAFSKAMFLLSGSEAVESALKIARQYQVFRGQTQRVNFIARKDSYHGNTLGALAAGYNLARRSAFAPILSPAFHHVSRCLYPADAGDLTEEAYEDKLIAEFEAEFQRLGPETVVAVIVEPVVGSTLGSAPATKNYLPRLKALCHKHGALVIFDEVMSGMGRVGSYHAWQSLGGVAPDLQTIGKGLGAGYQPLSAVLVAKEVYETLQAHSSGPGAFLNGHTFQGHSMACAGALTVQTILFRDGLVENCKRMGGILESKLLEELPQSWREHGGSIRGLGLFRSVDFGNLGQATVGGPLAKQVAETTFELGAAVYLCSSVVDAILICPPFIISEEQIVELAEIFVRAVNSVIGARQTQLA